MDTVGVRLRRARELAGGLSAGELGRLAGLSSAHVGLIERGTREAITGATALALSDVLGCSVEWLIAGRVEPPTAAAVTAAVAAARSRSVRPEAAS